MEGNLRNVLKTIEKQKDIKNLNKVINKIAKDEKLHSSQYMIKKIIVEY